jgi:hypothetical protein
MFQGKVKTEWLTKGALSPTFSKGTEKNIDQDDWGPSPLRYQFIN